MVEVIAEDEVVARYSFLGRKGEGDGVAVVGVLWRREVGRSGRRVFGEALERYISLKYCYYKLLDSLWDSKR